ncbi:Serine/threonine protein kinase [Candidatus Sulfopaludibacter sp. SbA4]|nr:Serine/threonine protein kinase [Candidatus Sulfopaludibacter sp. SbA4]
MPLAAGTRLGPYEIVAPLGAGGMGEVYRARDTRLGRDVALKILPADFADDPSRRQRFEQEARAVAALNHPNIVAIHDVGENYIVTELVDGEPLRGGKFGFRKTVDIAAQIAAGLAAAHDAGIVHRDLKPENILLTREGRVKILDFGLAKRQVAHAAGYTETLSVRTAPGTVMGTVGYMSPEQVRGLDVDHRSDLFSFGLILYELLAGKRAYTGDTSVEIMTAILKNDPPELPEAVPAGVRQIVSHCLEKEPVNRFQSARDLGFALAQSGTQTGAAAAVKRRSPWSRRGLAAIAAAALAALAFLAGRSLGPEPPPSWTGVRLGGPEEVATPRLAPDGHMLAFRAAVGDIWQVGVMKEESGNWNILTHNRENGYVQSLGWSPDGARIYYDRLTDVPRGIYSVPVLGGEERLVLEDASAPEALPDGSLLISKYNPERQLQMSRFWPETGQLQGYPIQTSDFSPYASFPDGREAAVIGTLIGAGREAGKHLYLVDLESGRARRLPSGLRDDSTLSAVGVTRDGKSVVAAGYSADLQLVIGVPPSGRSPARSLLALTSGVISLDTGPDGSIYLGQEEDHQNLVRFPPGGGKVERIVRFAGAENTESFTVLPDGRAVTAQMAGGRFGLMLVEAGKDPSPLVDTSEETTGPVTTAGPHEIAFLIGPAPRRTIALAAVSNGRITRRIPFDHGPISALAASPDGKTLYCAADGVVWAIPSSGGEARKIRAGDHVAVDPAGQYLLVEVTETPVIRLWRVPLNGGVEQEIPQNGPFRPGYNIGPNAVGSDGRILIPLGASTWYWPPGLIDPASGRFTRIPADLAIDYHVLAWTPDGQVMAMGFDSESTMWRFTPEVR